MGKKAKNYSDYRLQQSMIEHSFYVKKLEKLVMSMFQWYNLPDGIPSRFIEKVLYNYGFGVMFKNDAGFIQFAKATKAGFNSYDEPTHYQVYDITGYSKVINAVDTVPILNNKFWEDNKRNVYFFSKRISQIEKTIESNLNQLKHPTIFGCPEGQIETIKRFWAKVENGEPFIPVSEDFRSSVNIQTFNMNAQNHVKDLQEVKHDYENEALTFFGINNVNILKKERLITGEAEQNNEQIILSKNDMLDVRRESAELINRMFHLDIRVIENTQAIEALEEFIEGDE